MLICNWCWWVRECKGERMGGKGRSFSMTIVIFVVACWRVFLHVQTEVHYTPSPLGRDTAKSSIVCPFLYHIFWLSLYLIQYISPDMEIRLYSSTNLICKPLSQAWNQSFFNLALSPRLYVSMDASLRVLCEKRVLEGREVGGRVNACVNIMMLWKMIWVLA